MPSHSVMKKTGTYADGLHAIGLAHLLRELTGAEWGIQDCGDRFEVASSSVDANAAWREPEPGFLYVWDSKREQTRPSWEVFDYRREVEKRDLAKVTPRRRMRAQLEAADVALPDPPSPRLQLAAALSSMRKGWKSDRVLYQWLQADRARALSWARKKLLNSDSAVVDPLWSNSQVLNPITGKGIHNAKSQFLAPNAFNAVLLDPFEEWLKLRALWVATLAYRDDGDYKFMTVMPGDIRIADLNKIVDDLRRLNLWGGVKLDIQAVLRCAELLIQHSDVLGGSIELRGRRPNQIIHGIRQAHFKSLGTASALMNEALLGLPGWFNIKTPADAELFISMVDGFIGSISAPGGCLGALDARKSDEGTSLQVFRNWLNTGERDEFLEFSARFAVHVLAKKAAGDWVLPMTVGLLDNLFDRGYGMNDVVNNEGFRSVARAIRNSTIYSEKVGGPVKLDTRFGLAQAWKQKLRAGKPELIMAAVAEFVQAYNWEVQRGGISIHKVSTEDLDQLLNLMNGDHQTIAMLLLAYGYAVQPKGAQNGEAAS